MAAGNSDGGSFLISCSCISSFLIRVLGLGSGSDEGRILQSFLGTRLNFLCRISSG